MSTAVESAVYTEERWKQRTAHRAREGNSLGHCAAVVFPDAAWPGNRLCHLPILYGRSGWRHETWAEFSARMAD